jgi:Asp-tRNA(Asn)/Glu-tRNA(Gln) amidotransferase A subunit family amidase
MTTNLATTRRRFLSYFSSIGLTSTLLPGALWAEMQQQAAQRVSPDMLKSAMTVAGLEYSDDELQQMVNGVNQNLDRYQELRKVHIDDGIAPPLYYSPLVPGTRLDRVKKPFRPSDSPAVKRPANLEDVAFWPIANLAQLIRSKQVKSVELTEMYMSRLKKFNPKLNCVVTFTDDLAMKQARQADQEIAAGRYRGPLHGIPWGCKDIIAVPGYPTTWGSDAFKSQVIESEATVVRLLREAGAVLLAKLTSGELASGDQWFGGRTNNPWDLSEGSSGSSAGPSCATAAGCVAFGIGTETSGSILSPSTRCGCSGLRPTFGRVSRYGAMTLSWTQDRLGPICRTVEDCAYVFSVIARPDDLDLSVIDLPFNWVADLDIKKLRVGYLEAAFRDSNRSEDLKKNDQAVLDQLKSMGVTLEPFSLPELPYLNLVGGFGVESAVSFDEKIRAGKDKQFTNKTRGNGFKTGHFTPAVEFLQGQRVRHMIMRQFADVVGKYDVYVAPFFNTRGDPPAAGGGARGGAPPAARPAPGAMENHFTVANLCGYPAVAVPNGFAATGQPTSITFMGRLYNEAAVLALAKAYQDASGFHLKHPRMDYA